MVVWCGVVWCGVVWCGVVWCGVVWCGVVWCGVVWCGVVWYGMVWYGGVGWGGGWGGVVSCGVVWCGVVWCRVVSCDVVWGGVVSCGVVLCSVVLCVNNHAYTPLFFYSSFRHHRRVITLSIFATCPRSSKACSWQSQKNWSPNWNFSDCGFTRTVESFKIALSTMRIENGFSVWWEKRWLQDLMLFTKM